MKLLRTDEALISIPVVVLSASQARPPELVKAVLRKPFDVPALVDVVNQHCPEQ